MPLKYKGVSPAGEKWTIPLIVLCFFAISWPWFYLLTMQGVLPKLTHFVTDKPPFYITSFLSLSIIYWAKKKWYSHVFNFKEFLIMLPFVFFANYGYTALLFFWSTNMYDTEIWNGYVVDVAYYEEWTEEDEVCTTDDDGNMDCTTYYYYHSPYWQLISNNDEVVSISSTVYRRYVNLFQNEQFSRISRPDRVSNGDGNMYACSFNGDPGKLTPTAISHAYVNYIRAAEPIFLYTGYTADYAKDLVSYPTTKRNEFGAIYLNHVISPNLDIDPRWTETLNRQLSHHLAYLGKEKQVNALVYLTQRDTTFYRALHEMWYGGKKNDVIVLIGSENFPKIDWVRVMSWTDSKIFKNNLREQILALEDLSAADSLSQIIHTQIAKPAAEGGFVRKPMDEFNELRSAIHLPLLAYFYGILISLLIQIPLVGIFIMVDIE